MLLQTLIAVFCALGTLGVQAMPSPDQIAQFKADYKLKLDAWLATKATGTAACIEDLIT